MLESLLAQVVDSTVDLHATWILQYETGNCLFDTIIDMILRHCSISRLKKKVICNKYVCFLKSYSMLKGPHSTTLQPG